MGRSGEWRRCVLINRCRDVGATNPRDGRERPFSFSCEGCVALERNSQKREKKNRANPFSLKKEKKTHQKENSNEIWQRRAPTSEKKPVKHDETQSDKGKTYQIK